MVPVHIGGNIAEIEVFRTFVAEPSGDFVHGKRIAGWWRIAVREQGVAVARSQTHPVGFAMTCKTLAVIGGLIVFIDGDRDIQSAECRPFGLLEIVRVSE